jgi:hypothetical protein
VKTLRIALFVIALAVAAVAQTTPAGQAPATPIDSTVQALPDSPAGDTYLWWASVGTNGLAAYLKWNSSWKQPADTLHAQPSGPYAGRYYIRGTVYDFGTVALSTTLQYLLCRKFPALKKTFSYVNFGNAGVSFAQFGYNATNH